MVNRNSSFHLLQHALNFQTFFTLSTPFKACSLLLYFLIRNVYYKCYSDFDFSWPI